MAESITYIKTLGHQKSCISGEKELGSNRNSIAPRDDSQKEDSRIFMRRRIVPTGHLQSISAPILVFGEEAAKEP